MPIGGALFVQPNDPILKQTAEAIPVDQITRNKTQEIVETMLGVAYGEQKGRTKPVLVGLAAPQIGISKRIILVDIGADGHGGVSNLQVYINPKITWRSRETNEWYEGCFSTGRICGIVKRPTSIWITAYDRTGKQVHQKLSGYVARIFQHEIDHLNGKVFISHITDDNNLHWVEQDEFPEYRNNEAWRDWKNKCPREKWSKISRLA
jgi:peptide deformylase